MTSDVRSLSPNAAFLTTRWTRVRLAKADSEDGRVALADLCDAYYEPVVTFLRCELRDADAAREASHAFFAQVLAGGAIESANRERGRFRSYLLGAVKHFLSHQREALLRQKRGGGVVPVSLDDEEAAAVADAGAMSPDAAFDRQWALTVLERGMEALRLECEAEGRGTVYAQARALLSGDTLHGGQAELAEACGLSLAAFRMVIHRMKKRLRQLVKDEVAGTLDDPALVQEELESLLAALGG